MLSFANSAGQKASCTGKKKKPNNPQGVLFGAVRLQRETLERQTLPEGFPAAGLTFGSRSAKCSQTTAKDLPFSAKWQGCGWRQQPSRGCRPCQGKQPPSLQRGFDSRSNPC